MQSEKDHNLDLDELLPKIGEFGKYQKLVIWLICLPAVIPCSLVAFNQLFMTDVPPHWCKIPELDFLSEEERRDIGIPKLENTSWDSCKRYSVNWTDILQKQSIENIVANTSWPTENCLQGYEYDKSVIPSSIVIEFDLVCDYTIYPTIGLVILNLGSPIGVYIFGYLNDKYGRKKSYFMVLSTVILGNVFSAFAPNFGIWSLSRFIAGCTVPAVYHIPFILGLEIVGPNYRSLVTITSCAFYTTGLMILGGAAYLVRDWFYLTLVTSLPFLLYYFYWFYMPESPRWLLANGQFDSAVKLLEKMAKVNKKKLPSNFDYIIDQEIEIQKKLVEARKNLKLGPKILGLCRTPNMRIKTALITFNWFANITTYVGLNYYGPALGDNPYLSFFLSSLVEMPSYIFVYFTLDTWGRKWPFAFSMIMSGISAVTTVLLPEGSYVAILVLYLISKMAITSSLTIIYQYAGEIFPTELRGIGLGTAAYVGGLGLALVPFVVYLGKENIVIPLVILGSMSVLGGISALRLPETLNHPMPQNLEEAEDFGKNWSIDQFCQCVPNKKPRKTIL